MLDVVILRNEHSTASNAHKINQYLDGVTLYAPERALTTASEALQDERDWKKSLESTSPEEYRKMDLHAGKQFNEFFLEEDILLLERKIPIYPVERFSDAEAVELEILAQDFVDHYQNAMEHLYYREKDQALNQYWQQVKKMMQVTDRRDQHIAGQISVAREALSGKFMISLGGLHEPEKYLDFPVEVIDLTNMTPSSRKNFRSIIEGTGLRYLRKFLKSHMIKTYKALTPEQRKAIADHVEDTTFDF